jgi:hypothetical protein
MRSAGRLTRILTMSILGLLTLGQGMAFANNIPVGGSASPSPAGNGVDLHVKTGTETPGDAGGRGASTGVTCTSVPLATINDPSIPDPGLSGGVTGNGQVVAPGTAGTWVFTECYNADGSLAEGVDVGFLPDGQPVDPQQLLAEARRHLALPGPKLQLSPSADQWQYVQMPTWAWVPKDTWAPLTASAAAGGVSVTVTATPIRLDLTYQTGGKGTTATASCNGPGTPYDPQLAQTENPRSPVQAASPDCGWTWQGSSVDTQDEKYAVGGHIVYHAVWAVAGAAGGGDLGNLPGDDSTFRVAVGEIQALNLPPR